MSEVRLHHGDCLDVLRSLPEASVDAVVTDPPYGLAFMGKRWDYDVPPVEVWEECLRVLRDGGRLLCFAGTRTMHRMWCNIEDAGFTIEDSIAWMYGSGFPKHRSKLKPAYEPVCVARKGSVAPLNIDVCRIAGGERPLIQADRGKGRGHALSGGLDGTLHGSKCAGSTTEGRWPANVLLDEEAAALLDEQSGTLKSGARRAGEYQPLGMYANALGSRPEGMERSMPALEANKGGASRFYYVAKASKRERGEGNTHPTVKPVSLMEHLCKLVTPPGGAVLDPYMGSGTTGLAAVRNGFRFVGIEREAEYLEIARRRITAEQPALLVA